MIAKAIQLDDQAEFPVRGVGSASNPLHLPLW